MKPRDSVIGEHRPEPGALEPLLDVGAVAGVLGCGRTTVWRLTRSGRLPSLRIGDLLRYDPADVRRFLAEHRTNNAA